MFGWFKRKTETAKIAEVLATKIDLKPGEQLFITFKSDYIEAGDILPFRDQLRNAFPNNKIAVIVIGQDDDVKFSTVNPLEEEKDGPTNG